MSLLVGAATFAAGTGGHPGWAATPLEERARLLARAATRLAADAETLAAALRAADGRPEEEVWSAEIVPTLEALRWLASAGARALRPRRLGRARLQWYFGGTRHEQHWEPRGVVAVITPSNSLLFLAVPQVAAALLAGNTVRWKPAKAKPRAEPPAARKSPKAEDSRIRDLEKRLAEALDQLQTRTDELDVALERQTATSEILRIISSSPTDLTPVAQAIADSAARLCDCTYTVLFRFDGELIHWVAAKGVSAAQEETLQAVFPRRVGPETTCRPDDPRGLDAPYQGRCG